jgi:hypothetical protein
MGMRAPAFRARETLSRYDLRTPILTAACRGVVVSDVEFVLARRRMA